MQFKKQKKQKTVLERRSLRTPGFCLKLARKWEKNTIEPHSVPNPSFIGRWILGEPMARERERKRLIHKYQRKIIQNNTKGSSSYTKQRCGLFFSNLSTARKLKSKAQSLPHVYPSTSVCLSPCLGYLGEAGFSEDNCSFYSLEILNHSCQKIKKNKNLQKVGRGLSSDWFSILTFRSEECWMMMGGRAQ